jgi:hypothetical protein
MNCIEKMVITALMAVKELVMLRRTRGEVGKNGVGQVEPHAFATSDITSGVNKSRRHANSYSTIYASHRVSPQ